MANLEYLVENEVVPALHRIAVALERLAPRGVVLTDEEVEWTRTHGELPLPKAKKEKS